MDYARLRASAFKSGGDEEAVTVDTRALIDKVLARYSGEWTTLRELIQNAADAQATKVTIKWETQASPTVPVPTTTDRSQRLKHVLSNHTLRSLVVENDGQPFTKTDWGRLKRIAEGNPDETKIGAFGVGFYSVFADCEEPLVTSGSEAMAFFWKGNALFTKKTAIPSQEATSKTAFILEYRNTTSPLPNLLSVAQFLATSLTFVKLQGIEFWIDDWQVLALQKKSSPSAEIALPRDLETGTTAGLMKLAAANRTSTQIDATFMSALGWKPEASNLKPETFYASSSSSEIPSLKSFFSRFTAGIAAESVRHKALKEEKAAQDTIAEDLTVLHSSSIFLRVISAQAVTKVTSAFAAELERATKKPPPPRTEISILTSSYDETAASESAAGRAAKVADVFSTVLPNKKPGGRIFIGFPTQQTTGAGLHISAPSVIPTVEREAIDLNARHVRTWNQELLRVAGIVSRLAFSNEMSELSEKLKRLAEPHNASRNVVSALAVQKCIPEALHILKTYSFTDSTPNPKVAEIMEDAFWTARHSIEVFSSRGVTSTADTRVSPEEVGKFVSGVPVILNEMKDAPFIQKLVQHGVIREITIPDICKELASKALDKEELLHFVTWLAKGAVNGNIDAPSRQSLLTSAVAMINDGDGDSGNVIQLGSITNFLGHNIHSSFPIPPTTLPAAYTAKLPQAHLQALGWQPLRIDSWLRFLVEATSGRDEQHDISKSPQFALRVLEAVSKSWENLGVEAKSSVVHLLQGITVIPTRVGMKKPGESFFQSVKLFDDLPTIETGNYRFKDKFLLALGVRKTVDLDTIFTRLLRPPPSDTGAHQTWSHMELIKYLVSVKDDIPDADMKKLKDLAFCPAEAERPGHGGTEKLYKLSALYEPKDTLRSLKLPLLYWPGPPGSFRNSSAEAKFLFSLGLRPFPPVAVLIDLMSSGDPSLRGCAMSYFLGNHHINSYAKYDLAAIPQAILPIQGKPGKFVSPSACYTNEKAAILGYDILQTDLHPHASKFGVQRDPQIAACVERLVANPPQNRNAAIALFEYFATRLNELGQNHVARLKDALIVPVVRKTHSSCGPGEKAIASVSYTKPQLCYLGSSSTYGDIFDFVDFGPNANTFLFKCGAKNEPTKREIAELACGQPAWLLSVLQSSEKYLDLLRSLVDELPTLRQQDRDLYKRMKTAPWLLGFRELSSAKSSEDDDKSVKQYELARASQIVVLDDYISFRLFKNNLLCAPEDDGLERLYMTLGSQTLGSQVEENITTGPPAPRQDGAEQLRLHVLERTKIFLHEFCRTRRDEDMIKRDEKWLEKNLQVRMVRAVQLRRSLKGHPRSEVEARSAAMVQVDGTWVLYVVGANPDMYQVGQAICQQLLTRPSQSAYIFFEPFLTLELLQLRARGYNVDRILRAKAAQERIAEEKRIKALEAEQEKIKQRDEEWARERALRAPEAVPETPERHPLMPGTFKDETEDEPADPIQNKSKKGLWSNISRHLGFDTDERGQQQPETSVPPQPTAHGGPAGPSPTPGGKQEVEDVTSPADVQQNLLNAVKSTRAHDSSRLFSQPQVREVKEQGTYCDSTGAHDLDFVAEAPKGMRVFSARDLSVDKGSFLTASLDHIGKFEAILNLVGEIYDLPTKSMHIFYDEHGTTIAFNLNGSIFCNLRWFIQLHAAGVQGTGPGRGQAKALSWWSVIVAHELAHNLVGPHNSEHGFYTEAFVQEYFDRIVDKCSRAGGAAAGARTGTGSGPAPPSGPPPAYRALPDRSLLD